MQDRSPRIWSQSHVMFNIEPIWTQDYAKAKTLVQELYKNETTQRSELICEYLNDNPVIIAQEVQKVLQRDLQKIESKIASIIDQYIKINSPATVKPGDIIMTAQTAIHGLNVNMGRKKKLGPNEYCNSTTLTSYELADKYEKACSKKKAIKTTEKEFLKVFSNLKISNNSTLKNSM